MLLLVLGVCAASVASALVPLINIEAILAAAVLSSPGAMVPLVLAATVGQMAGKVLWYWGGMNLDRARWVGKHLEKPRVEATLELWHARAEGRPWFTAGLMLVSATIGIPPYAVTAVLAGVLRVPMWIFLVTGLVGRGLRFWAVATGTEAAVGLW